MIARSDPSWELAVRLKPTMLIESFHVKDRNAIAVDFDKDCRQAIASSVFEINAEILVLQTMKARLVSAIIDC